MSDGDTAADAQPGLAKALDWTAGRTWLVFGIYGVALGATSGVIIVETEVIGAALFRPAPAFILITVAMSLALHLGVLFILSKLIPLRDATGKVVHDHRVLTDRPSGIFKSFWPFLAFFTTVGLASTLVIVGQSFFELPPSVGFQACLPFVFATGGTHFPASHLVAKQTKHAEGKRP